MTSCSLTRIQGFLRVRVTGEQHRPFYRTFTVSPSISLPSSTRARPRTGRGPLGARRGDSGSRPGAPRPFFRDTDHFDPIVQDMATPRPWLAPTPPLATSFVLGNG